MAAQARRRPGSPDLEKLAVDPEAGLAGIPAPARKKENGDVRLNMGPITEDVIERSFAAPLLPDAIRSAKVTEARGRRRRTKKKSRKAGRRKTRK